jgi:hypothetical protein
MSLKTRMAKLSRGREQTLIRIIGGLADREPADGEALAANQIPYTPRLEGETEGAWVARLEALGRELYPHARFVIYGGLPTLRLP